MTSLAEGGHLDRHAGGVSYAGPPDLCGPRDRRTGGAAVRGRHVVPAGARVPVPAALLYGDHDRFVKTYFSEIPGCYFAGDGARRDEDGLEGLPLARRARGVHQRGMLLVGGSSLAVDVRRVVIGIKNLELKLEGKK